MKNRKFKMHKLVPLNLILFLIGLLTIPGCKKSLEVPAPTTSLNSANVFESDATAASVLTGIYTNMSLGENFFGSAGKMTTLPLYTALSADELTLYSVANDRYSRYYTNALTSTDDQVWSNIYQLIFKTNTAIEGLTASKLLTTAVKQQLMGEAKFLRAFFYFYLVNLYGDVPMVTTTDYKVNSLLPRTPQADVYKQIIADLLEAQSFLNANYVEADGITSKTATGRVRPNKFAATALLARAYLYTGDFTNAEIQATAVIDNSTQYSLPTDLNKVFLSSSKEAIWQLLPVGDYVSNTGQGALYVLPDTGPDDFSYPVYLSDLLVNKFETGDKRKEDWTGNVDISGTIYYYPYKYKIGVMPEPLTEYIMVLRLAEQYLIRAEARTKLGKLSGAADDLNAIRSRAGLSPTTASSQDDLLLAIQQERAVELFTEWGDRWLNMKRTKTVDGIMPAVVVLKGGTWSTNWQWYPIPDSDIGKDPNLRQNSGY